jgi:hypothetical protein
VQQQIRDHEESPETCGGDLLQTQNILCTLLFCAVRLSCPLCSLYTVSSHSICILIKLESSSAEIMVRGSEIG